MTTLTVGSEVRFYDSDKAFADRDFSGNEKHFPVGKVLKIYNYKSFYGYIDKVCDIQIGERISKAHFVSAVEVL